MEAGCLRFVALGCLVQITVQAPQAWQWLRANFAAFPAAGPTQAVDLHYEVRAGPPSTSASGDEPCFMLHAADQAAIPCHGGSELLFQLEQHLVVALEQARPDLLFLHAAALVHRGRACLLVGESGVGKSTTAWALVQRGWGYLSDELAPLDPRDWQVQPYPHALCLKQPPPGAAAWPPPGLIDLGATMHLPLPAASATGCAVGAIVFLQQTLEEGAPPSIQPLSTGHGAALLYVDALNLLAHPERGVDVVKQAAQSAPRFKLEVADPAASAELLERHLLALPPTATERGSPGGSPGPRRTA